MATLIIILCIYLAILIPTAVALIPVLLMILADPLITTPHIFVATCVFALFLDALVTAYVSFQMLY